jgi:hypothetical protein
LAEKERKNTYKIKMVRKKKVKKSVCFSWFQTVFTSCFSLSIIFSHT